MKQFILTFLAGILIGSASVLLWDYFHKPEVGTNTIIRVDSFPIVRDSIITRIDTITKTKTQLRYVYQEQADSIWNQSADADWQYFINYLSARFPSDSNSAETDKPYLQLLRLPRTKGLSESSGN